MDHISDSINDSSTDIPSTPPSIIELSKYSSFADCTSIIISETEAHNKRLSFHPKFVPYDDNRSSLRGHLVYEPIKKGNGI